ncbi:unnamed protein product, partial [marine sediment metagenome]
MRRLPSLLATMPVLVSCIAGAGERDRPARSINELIFDLKYGDHRAADAAKYDLGNRGKEAVPALIALVKDST